MPAALFQKFSSLSVESRALRQAAEELKLRKLTVLTLDTEKTLHESGYDICVVPCRKWLFSH